MNIEDLMIYDLVSYDGMPLSIKYIDSKNNILFADYKGNSSFLTDLKIDIKQTEPIKLSNEFLIKNGFECYCETNYTCYFRQKDNDDQTEFYNIDIISYNDNLDEYIIDIENYNNGMSLRIKCKYIHELQHGLRICSLKEIANNFNV